MAFSEFEKSPAARLDYSFDWETYLDGQGTILSSSWSTDDGITVESDLFTNTTTTAYVSGGVEGNSYFISNTVSTTNGLTVTRSFIVKVVLR